MPLRALVFDFDGIIADTEPLHFEAFQRVLAPQGRGFDEARYLAHYLSYDDRGVFGAHFEHLGLPLDAPTLAGLIAAKGRAFEELAATADVHPFPGFLDLFHAAHAEMPVAVCTSALRSDVEPLLRRFGVFDQLAALTTADEVARAKPDPEGYALTARRLAARVPGLAPAELVAIEDSPGGLRAALAAGYRTAGVAHTCPPDRLTHAHRVFPRLADVRLADLKILAG